MSKFLQAFFFVTIISLAIFSKPAHAESQYRAYASHYSSINVNNHKYEVLSVHVKDRNSANEYYVEIKIKDGTWVGSPVRLKDQSEFSDRQNLIVLQEIPKSTQGEILNEVAQSFERLKEYSRKTDVPDVVNANQTTSRINIFNVNSNAEKHQSNINNSYNNNKGSDDVYARAAQHKRIMSDAASRLQNSKWSAERHLAQQNEIQEKIRYERDVVKNSLAHNIKQSETINNFQKADIAYALQLEFERIERNSKFEDNGFDQKYSDGFEYVNLDSQLQAQFKDELRNAIMQKNWALASNRASQLYNPWNKLRPDADMSPYVDKYGILKGPALGQDTINIAKLAQVNPDAAYTLLKSANQLQAVINKQPYFAMMRKTGSIIKSTNVLMSLAANSGSRQHIDQAASLANYFSGKPSKITITQNEKGLISFSSGTELKNVLSENGGEVNLGKAVYNELAQNLSWLDEPKNQVLVVRNNMPSIDLGASSQKFIGQIDSSGEWLSKNRQKYPVQIPRDLRFSNSEFNRIYANFAGEATVDFPIQKDAREKSIASFLISEALNEIQSSTENVNWGDLGLSVADIGTGFIPVVSTVKDVFELVVGRNLVTGEILNSEQRTFAALGVITFGIGSKVHGVYDLTVKTKKFFKIKGVEKSMEAAFDIASHLPTQRLEQILEESRAVLKKTESEFSVISKNNSEVVNGRWKEPAYWQGLSKEHAVDVLEVETKVPTILARVSNADNKVGHWLLKPDDIKGLSPLQIKEKFNLPSMPTHVEVVELPTNIRMNIGVVGPNKFGNNVGPLQFEILEKKEFLKDNWNEWVTTPIKKIEALDEL